MDETLKVKWKRCNGDAHQNPMIDHCGICIPYWEVYPTCPLCHKKVSTTKRSPFAFYCGSCRKFLLDNKDQMMDIYGSVYKSKPMKQDNEIEVTDHWNYRVVKMMCKSGLEYSVHEVYYTKDGSPVMITQDEVGPAGSDRIEFARCVLAYNEAYTRPVLIYDTENTQFKGEETSML
jgi:hypothetical protein